MISVAYVDRPPGSDGIRDFSDGLVDALAQLPGVDAQLVLWTPDGGWPRALAESSSIFLQYNPFSYGRGGFAPGPIAHLRRRSKASLCIMVHEPYVAISDARTAAMGGWQRLQLRLLLGMADAVGVSTDGFRSYLPAHHLARARHIPVGSPLPDARDQRAGVRTTLGVSDTDLVVALYGSGHASRLLDHAVRGIVAIAGAGDNPLVLNLGFAAPQLRGLPKTIRVITPGALPPRELAAHLAAADLALLPYIDGASTRRTTMIAAMQQGTCVVSTRGPLTDRVLTDAGSPILTASVMLRHS